MDLAMAMALAAGDVDGPGSRSPGA